MSPNMRSSVIVALICLGALSQGSAQGPGPSAGPTSIAAALQSNPNLSYLLAAAQAAGLAGTLSNPSAAYTVLAPNNAAISEALTELGITVQDLLSDASLPSILTYHIIPSVARSTDLSNGQVLPTLLTGSTLKVVLSGGSVVIEGANNNATVIQADIQAGQSVVHVIDSLLIPSDEVTNSAPAQAPNVALAETTLGLPSTTGRKLLLAN